MQSMPIKNPSKQDLEDRLKKVKFYRLDGNEYIIMRDLVTHILGTTYHKFSKFRRNKKFLDSEPSLVLGYWNYYTRKQAKNLYAALYL